MIKLSASSLQAYYSGGCPRRWKLGREYELIDTESYFVRGLTVHSVLEGKLPLGEVADGLARSMAEKLLTLRKALGLTILQTEVTQVFELPIGVKWERRMDAIAQTSEGEIVILDYKTSGAGWKTVGEYFPTALNFQSISYLYETPGQHLADLGIGSAVAWPKTLMYLIAPMRGTAQVVSYAHDPEDVTRWLALTKAAADQIQMYTDNDDFPPIYDSHCADCKVAPVCFGLSNWGDTLKEKHHEPRKKSQRKAVKKPKVSKKEKG